MHSFVMAEGHHQPQRRGRQDSAVLSGGRLISVLNLAASLLLVAGLVTLVWPHRFGGGSAFVMVSGTSMQPTMHTGDLAIVRQQRGGYRQGDIVAFRVPAGEAGGGSVVIHRVVGGDGTSGYELKGDNRSTADRWRPLDGDVVGRRIVLIPRAGHLVEGLRAPLPLAGVAGLGAALIALTWRPRRTAESR